MERADENCRTMTIEAAAKELGISRSSCYEAAHRGELPVVKIGRRLLVPKHAFNQLFPAERDAQD
jgi:excisionase family DNA binding protein